MAGTSPAMTIEAVLRYCSTHKLSRRIKLGAKLALFGVGQAS